MIRVITAPTEYPVSLAEAKAALLVDHDQDDALIARLVAAATEEAETLAARSLCTRTVELVLDAWPAGGSILLEYPPVQSVTSITYYDDDNAAATMPGADYFSVLDVAPPWVALAKNADWPTATLRSVSPIRVRYVAGYGSAAAVPARYKALILGLVAVDYENREALSPQGVVQRERLQAALKMDWGWAT
jgi:uncharacterized phiE125 gp8 family phage protein